MYEIEVRHSGLGKYRHIKGRDKYVVEQKALAQKMQWDEMWQKRLAQDKVRLEREQRAFDIRAKKEHADILTEEAEAKLQEVDSILTHTLSVNDAIVWNSIKDQTKFPTKRPPRINTPTPPREPLYEHFAPKLNLFDKIFKPFAQNKISTAAEKFKSAHEDWTKAIKAHKASEENAASEYQLALDTWQAEKKAFEEAQSAQHASVDQLKKAYEAHSPDAILEYFDLVLSRSTYPDNFPQQFELFYTPENKTLVVEYTLPTIEVFPKLKSVSYIQSKNDFKESYISQSALNKTYDKALYEIALRTLHECFEADTENTIDAVAFNGWLHFDSPATGLPIESCILTLHTSREKFLQINLGKVEAKECFKALKGVSASKLHSITPVAPLLTIDKTDKRFIDGYNVIDGLKDGENLALMDWQDFEHLVREIFEKEFSENGGEVKVTQSSKDGGVDAIIFDPDPIRGGKIVIQAKRYSNTVGVSAVRDLYGTVMNEGANKGILITTSDFGPDAYSFAADKPISLLHGGNLLHLLEKHGHAAHIDLQAAKKINA